ncbi:hypothetical protein Tco_1060847 [Tanacetum coccineum]
MNAKLSLLEDVPLSTQSPKPFQSKNKGLVAETFDWDEEDVFDNEEMVQFKVLMALAEDEFVVGKTMVEMEENCVNEKWLNSSNKVSQCIDEQIPNQKKKILRINQLTETSSKTDVKENPFIHASMDYDHEMIPKSKDWVERHNPDSKLPNFNNGRILDPKSQPVNESLGLTEGPTDLESSKESGSEPQTPLPQLKIL